MKTKRFMEPGIQFGVIPNNAIPEKSQGVELFGRGENSPSK
jgi:hypothetical protein